MTDKTPVVLVPGLHCDDVLWEHQAEALADVADITVPDITAHDDIGDMAAAIVASSPERFALAGLSLGGYVAFEVVRRDVDRIAGATLVVIEECGHLPTLERPHAVSAAMRDWLEAWAEAA